RLARLSYHRCEIAIEIRETASCFARINRQLQKRHVQGEPNLTRQATDEREAPLSQCERFAVREHPQATLSGGDARPYCKLRIAAERGMMRDISSKRAIRIVTGRQRTRDLPMHHALTRKRQIVVCGLTDQVVCEIAVRLDPRGT